MEMLTACIKSFVVGGLLCVIGQVLIDKTKLTPARILTAYVVAGVLLGAVGAYQPIADWAGAGACVPLTGFGNTLAKGVRRRWRRRACWAPSPEASPPPPPASPPRCFSGFWCR